MPLIRKFLKRLLSRGFLLGSVLFLTGCGIIESTVWPGVSAEGNRVYVAYQNQVIALDVAARQELWQYTGENGGVQFYAPPELADGQVVVGDYGVSGGIFAGGRLIVKVHALEDGEISPPATRWIAEDQVSGRVFAGSLKANGKVFVGTGDNHFVALDSTTGEKVWDFRTGNAIWDTPAVHGRVVYLTSLDKNVYALDIDTGNLIWQVPLGGASAGSPVISPELRLIYVSSFDGNLYALRFEDGRTVWKAPAADWVWGSPVLVDRVVYYCDLQGNVYAVSAADGKPVWSTPQKVSGSVQAPVAVHDGRLFVVSGDEQAKKGYITAFTLEGQQLWQVETPAAVRANPVIADGALVVAFAGEEVPLQVVRYNPESGASEWQYTPAVAQ